MSKVDMTDCTDV